MLQKWYNIQKLIHPKKSLSSDTEKRMRKVQEINLIALFSLIVLYFGCSTEGKKDMNVILVSLDTTRFDYIDTGRGAKAHTPELRRFSAKSVVFENAFSTSSETLPSHLSVFTSYLPHEFGVYSNEHRFRGSRKMIQQVFEESGYSTEAVISLGTLASSTGFNIGFHGFREDLFEEGIFYVPAEKITQEAIESIQKLRDQKFFLFVHYSDPHSPYAPPDAVSSFKISLDGNLIADFNAYSGSLLKKILPISRGTHVMEFSFTNNSDDFQHFIIRKLEIQGDCSLTFENLEFSEELYEGSYIMRNPESCINIDCKGDSQLKIFQIIPILKKRAALKYYREEVEYMDSSLGRLLRLLEKSRLLEKTVVVIFSDHGEGHGERDGFFGHTRYLNRQFIHVPLIIHLPEVESKRCVHPVSLIGISPSLFEYFGIRGKNFNHGESFWRGIKEDKFKEKIIYSEAFAPSAKTNKLSIIKWPYQAIFYLEKDRVKKREVYNLALSQSFTQNDSLQEEVIREAASRYHSFFEKRFNRFRRIISYPIPDQKTADKRRLEGLKALGYVDD